MPMSDEEITTTEQHNLKKGKTYYYNIILI